MFKFLKDERGSVVEYIILLAIVALIVTALFPGVKNTIEHAIIPVEEHSQVQKSSTPKVIEPIVSEPVVESTEVVSEPFFVQHPSIGLFLLFAFLTSIGALIYFLHYYLKKNDGKINFTILKRK